jgi:hypothetical protein
MYTWLKCKWPQSRKCQTWFYLSLMLGNTKHLTWINKTHYFHLQYLQLSGKEAQHKWAVERGQQTGWSRCRRGEIHFLIQHGAWDKAPLASRRNRHYGPKLHSAHRASVSDLVSSGVVDTRSLCGPGEHGFFIFIFTFLLNVSVPIPELCRKKMKGRTVQDPRCPGHRTSPSVRLPSRWHSQRLLPCLGA